MILTAGTTHEHLVRLHEVILEEREHAKALDMDAMMQSMQEKEELLQVLAHMKDLAQEDKVIAKTIRNENRRNAYLFKATLDWIRDTMEFFGKRTTASSYSADAGMVDSKINGRLLSGKV